MGKREHSRKHKRYKIDKKIHNKNKLLKAEEKEEEVEEASSTRIAEETQREEIKAEPIPIVHDETDNVDVESSDQMVELDNNLLEFATSSKIAVVKKFNNVGGNLTSVAASTSKKSTKSRRRDSGTSSGEERWLTAIESGKLDDVDDELKKIKNPKLMTARQRAIYDRGQDKELCSGELLMSLPIGYREREKPITAEDIQKAALKSQKRKQQADERREKDKKKTMERLLKKQENKQRSTARNRPLKAAQPMISYRSTYDGVFILMPPEHEFPLKAQTAHAPPPRKLCGIPGCGQLKIYNCSKTNFPLCSYNCYCKQMRQLMC